MNYSSLTRWLGTLLMLAVAGLNLAYAQTDASAEAIRIAASRSVGQPEVSFEVSSTNSVFTVLRINSVMNGSTHQGRNNEATAIAAAISDAITRDAQYSNIQSISVDYVERTRTQDHDRVIDRIDFRKNATGTFELHIT